MALMLSLVGILVPAQKTIDAKEIRKQQKEGRKDVRGATDVLRKIMNVPDKAIPRELLEKAEAISVFPSVVKAGFIVGGSGGDGVVARRTTNGWSAPVFYNIDSEFRSANRSQENRLHNAVHERRRVARTSQGQIGI